MRRLLLAVVLVCVGCADEIPEDVTEQMEAARTASEQAADTTTGPAAADLLVASPPGGHADWIRDIRTGLDTVPAQASLDRGTAQHIVRELYSRRFEALRRFYGTGGAAPAGPQLEQAVENAGARMQELIRQLAGSDSASIEQSVLAAQAALDDVAAAAQAAGLAPNAPRDVVTTTGS